MVVELGVFSVTAAVMLASTVGFVVMYFGNRFKSRTYLLLPGITGVAGLMYGVMALSAAGTVGNVITEARYLDWIITTPMIVAYIGLTAGADRGLIGRAVVADVVMIAVGYVASVTSAPVSWAAFAVSSAAFAYLLYLLVTEVAAVAEDKPAAVRSTFQTIRDLTVVLWLVYPVMWLIGPFGTGTVQTADYHFIIAVVDLVAKVGFDAVVAVRASKVSVMFGEEGGFGAAS